MKKEAVDVLDKFGFDGQQFRKRASVIDTAKLKTAVTVPLTHEHEELLLKASTGRGEITFERLVVGM